MDIKETLRANGIKLLDLANELGLSRPTLNAYINSFAEGEAIPSHINALFKKMFCEESIGGLTFRERYNHLIDEFQGNTSSATECAYDDILTFVKLNQTNVPLIEPLKAVVDSIKSMQTRRNDENLLELFPTLESLIADIRNLVPSGSYGVNDIVKFIRRVAMKLRELLPDCDMCDPNLINVCFQDLTEYVNNHGKLTTEQIPAEKLLDNNSIGEYGDERYYFEDEDKITLGLYVEGRKTVILHRAFLFNRIFCGKSVFEVAAHEVFHWFQYELINSVIARSQKAECVEIELKAYKYERNFGKYIQPWNGYYAYKNQLVEKDAFWFEQYTFRKTTKDNRRNKTMKRAEQMVALVNDLIAQRGIKCLITSREFKKLFIKRYGKTEMANILPSDYCYNRHNKGLIWERRTFLFEYKGNETYCCLGEDYPYTGIMYARPIKTDKDVPVGEWLNGKIIKKP